MQQDCRFFTIFCQYYVSLRSDISLHTKHGDEEDTDTAGKLDTKQASRRASRQGCRDALMTISPVSPPNRPG